MTDRPHWRTLAIKAAAAGPYQLVDRCHYCGGLEPLASFQPDAFVARVACCRRCRESRTGIPDDRGLIRATASVSRPLEELTPVRIAGLIPATCSETRPPAPPALDVDAIFAPWGSSPGELPELPGDADQLTADILALTDLDAQLDAMIADLDRRQAEGLQVAHSSTKAEAPALTFEALADLKAKYAKRFLRIIVGCPVCPVDSALELESEAVLFMGKAVLEALEWTAELAGHRPKGATLDSVYGTKLEHWGTKDDHGELGERLARALRS